MSWQQDVDAASKSLVVRVRSVHLHLGGDLVVGGLLSGALLLIAK